jgi:hypothetical protein
VQVQSLEHCLAERLVQTFLSTKQENLPVEVFEEKVLIWLIIVNRLSLDRKGCLEVLRSFFGQANIRGVDWLDILYVQKLLASLYPNGEFSQEMLFCIEDFYQGGCIAELRALFSDLLP